MENNLKMLTNLITDDDFSEDLELDIYGYEDPGDGGICFDSCWSGYKTYGTCV